VIPRTDRQVAVALGLLAVVVYLASIVGQTTRFDYFGRLAYALARGEFWLDGAPLSEIEPGLGGHFYNVQPPLVGILLVPLVPFGSPARIETFLCALLGALSAAPLYLALRALRVPRDLSVWTTILSLFGTTLWVTAADGRSWFAAHTAALLFATLALWLAATRRSPVLIGMALGAAALARTPLAFAAPGLLLLARREGDSLRGLARAALLLGLGALPFAAVQGVYDYARWGDPLDIYGPQLHQAGHPDFVHGYFSLDYLPRQLYAIFFAPPAFLDGQPFPLRARSIGMSLVATTPALLWLARSASVCWSVPAGRAVALAAALVFLPSLLFATVGYEQYGYRRILDAQPFLMYLLALGAGWSGAAWIRAPRLFRLAVVLSVAITFYFLVEIRRFGYAG